MTTPPPPKPFLKTTTAKVLGGLIGGTLILAAVLSYQEQRADTEDVASEATLTTTTTTERPTTTRPSKTFDWETRVEVTTTRTTYEGLPARTLTESEAALTCEDAIRLKLDYPATADFDAPYMSSGMNSQTVIRKQGGWEFRGKMTAENAFGVPQTLYYGCRVIGTTVEMAEVFAP